MRVVVVDDSAFMRKTLSAIISAERGYEVVGTARDGEDAYTKITQLRPDIITLDLEMPVLDGFGLLERLKRLEGPRPAVLVCSTLSSAGSHAALKALRLGATDVIAKNIDPASGGMEAVRADLVRKLNAIASSRRWKVPGADSAPGIAPGAAPPPTKVLSKSPSTIRSSAPAPLPMAAPAIKPAARSVTLAGRGVEVVLIGSSTGGPPVLEKILSELPADLTTPVVVAQHMPVMFTKSIAERLDEICALSVVHAEPEMPLHAGTVYITPGGMHSRVERAGRALRIDISPDPVEALYKPSVDELLLSGARTLGARGLGVVLTGMGADGLRGARELVRLGGMVIAQSAETCAVYGMPRAVIEAGVACAALSPSEIVAVLSQLSSRAPRVVA
jgi:two-component system chemotaxis response regulator CheB